MCSVNDIQENQFIVGIEKVRLILGLDFNV